jgi:protein-tyrosine-phosphatase
MENRVYSAGLAHGVVDQTAEPASDEIARNQRGDSARHTDAVLQEIVGQKFKLGSDGGRSFLLECGPL